MQDRAPVRRHAEKNAHAGRSARLVVLRHEVMYFQSEGKNVWPVGKSGHGLFASEELTGVQVMRAKKYVKEAGLLRQ